jgi:hypothetical protein
VEFVWKVSESVLLGLCCPEEKDGKSGAPHVLITRARRAADVPAGHGLAPQGRRRRRGHTAEPALHPAWPRRDTSAFRPARTPLPWESRPVVDLANGGVGARWFLALVLLGLAAALVSAAGPALALRRLRPHGPVLVLAARAAFLSAVTMGLTGAASMVAAVGLYLWAPAYAGYHAAWPLAVYLPAVLLAAAVAVVSAARGVRASNPPAMV